MPGQDIKLKTRDGEELDCYLSTPEGEGPWPGILIITAIFGTDEEMREAADKWASEGYIVSVPDVFWRVHPGPTADMEVAFDRYGKFPHDQGVKDIEDYINDLRGRAECNGKIGVIGYCFGGRYAHLSAARFGVQAAAAYHGTNIDQHLDEVANVQCPVTWHFGEEDPVIPMETVDKIREAYASKSDAEIVVHPGCGHNFSMPQKDGYNEAAYTSSRAATQRIFSAM